MSARFHLCPIGLAFAMAVPGTAFADQECLANGKSYQIGQVACLTVAEQSHLARCDMVLNNTSWTKIGDSCPENTLAPHPHVTPISTPAPSMVPTEPIAN
ncbi:hypothetical protein EN962_11200 [Mesorhizobium sp. M7A.F.Ca.CA.001.09.2.1]|uniref:hypothetical protein n=1 Tax=Mesorhizobium sp. BR1-1-3 TaxID=2876651 RepID=UPI00041175B6|nr:hypothetical protein [Mesorhizobium sp. BR1-1-3]AMX93244.1 hypothetical protein A4R28_09165 [Mesorhizobium ciceri]ARP65197.1 hypothetical protein A9K65_018785 [Mesorhizobium sp. WSM1497]RUU22610.1 hypothetical protein EOC84_05755 [Mesorhizobium sp. Primo-B]RUU35951.1 hypothetical protein EOC83_24305 [Mesorhizobium sp. Primo-A]RUX15422.1 hypothetical protein EN996_12915 [Mesorhizobium sp. M7A.F.Ca.CA.002.14.1.2]RUX36931.1 hypothetical protein EN987_22965 [Mesorhizobium sp. M7A.F.Ca.CA.002.1